MLPAKFHDQITKLGNTIGEPGLLDDVTEALNANRAIPFYSEKFCFVLKPVFDNNRQGLFIWLGIHNNKPTSIFDHAFLVEMAKKTGMSFIRFKSNRKGFHRLATKHGYSVVGREGDLVIYQLEVSSNVKR